MTDMKVSENITEMAKEVTIFNVVLNSKKWPGTLSLKWLSASMFNGVESFSSCANHNNREPMSC